MALSAPPHGLFTESKVTCAKYHEVYKCAYDMIFFLKRCYGLNGIMYLDTENREEDSNLASVWITTKQLILSCIWEKVFTFYTRRQPLIRTDRRCSHELITL